MSAEVIVLDVETSLDLPLDRILDGARANEVSDCTILAYDKDGDFYMASQTVDCGKLLIQLERARALILGRMGIS
jgi:hypothetical protein